MLLLLQFQGRSVWCWGVFVEKRRCSDEFDFKQAMTVPRVSDSSSPQVGVKNTAQVEFKSLLAAQWLKPTKITEIVLWVSPEAWFNTSLTNSQIEKSWTEVLNCREILNTLSLVFADKCLKSWSKIWYGFAVQFYFTKWYAIVLFKTYRPSTLAKTLILKNTFTSPKNALHEIIYRSAH